MLIDYKTWQAEQIRKQIGNSEVVKTEDILKKAILSSLSYEDETKKEDLCVMVSRRLGIIDDTSFTGAITSSLNLLLKNNVIRRTSRGFYQINR